MNHLNCGIGFLLRSVNVILFLAHLILRVSPLTVSPIALTGYQSPDLSLQSPDSSLILSSAVFLVPSGLPSQILNLYTVLSGHWHVFDLVSSVIFIFLRVLDYGKLTTLSFSPR